MGSCDYSLPGALQSLKPAVRGRLVTYLSPDTFLHIEPGLVARQVPDSESSMPAEKLLDLHAHMPAGPVHVKPDRIPAEPLTDLLQATQEPCSIAARRPHQPSSPQQGCDPAEDVQPMAMLTGCRDPKPLASFRPPHTETRMQAKARFVLKNHGLTGSQAPKFFLTPFEISWLHWLALECTNNWHASFDIPVDASNSGPAVPAALSRTGVPDAEPGSVHPIGLGSTRTQTAIFLSLSRAWLESLGSAAPAGPVGFSASTLQDLLRLLCASTDSGSDASGLKPRPPIPDADPPVSARAPQSSFQWTLPGLSGQRPQDVLGLPLDASTLNLDFSCCLCNTA